MGDVEQIDDGNRVRMPLETILTGVDEDRFGIVSHHDMSFPYGRAVVRRAMVLF